MTRLHSRPTHSQWGEKKYANRVVFRSAILRHGNGFKQQPAKQQGRQGMRIAYALSNYKDRPMPTTEAEKP